MAEDDAGTHWLRGGGELGALIRGHDWASSPLGPVSAWPQSLRSAVSILLPSRAQICLFWGPELVAIYNDAYRPTLGVKHPWALGRPAREVWSDFWKDILRPLLEGVLRTGDAFWASDHPFFLDRHGYLEETYFDISYDPVRDESGAVGGVFCIVSEMTGRVIGERRLRAVRALADAAMQARTLDAVYACAEGALAANAIDIPFAALYEWDEDRRSATRRLAVTLGTSAPERLPSAGGSWPLARATQDLVLVEGEAIAALGALPGGPWPEPARSAVLLPVTIPGHGPWGVLIAGISPRRAFDDGYADYLRLVASSLATGIANARALEAERGRAEALAQLDRAKTTFFSNVSHEFRTPLTLMLGPLADELATNAELPPASRQRLETAHRNALRLLKLVNTLLEFSRIEAGRTRACFEPTDLGALTAELASHFESACAMAGLRLKVACEALPEPVFVDRDLWEKIVLNLLSNAFKFTFEGGIEVRVAPAPGGAQLVVSDTGVGIAAHELPRIFERFHRVEGVRARTHEGSGIGLAMVHELVRLHGGEIRVVSEPGRGTTFDVFVPAGTAHLPREHLGSARKEPAVATQAAAFVEEVLGWLRGAQAEQLELEAPSAEAQDSARLLVVDDNADMREYMRRLLRSRWEVDVAADGEKALALLAAHPYDLVITDVMMPRLDGFGLLAAIRKDPSLAATPVIMLSARAGEEARIEGLEAGANEYLVKPFSARELVVQVKSLLEMHRLRLSTTREHERLLSREREARREAQLQREHLVSLFTQAPNPIVILRGPDYRIDLANPPACAVWNRSLDEVIGRPVFDVLPELRSQGFLRLLDGVVATGVPHVGREYPARFDRGSGRFETLYFNFVYSPLRAVDGGVEGILVLAFDVTHEMHARRELEGLRSEAEAANRTKDQFLAMLGHELRNPLSPIVTALQILRLRGMQAPELDVLERQARHLTRLVDDLLDVSRITRGLIELRRRRVEIAEVVAKALEMSMPLIEQRQHRVSVEVPAEGLAVDGDPDRLAQVVSNLLTNAAKYSEPRSGIEVRAAAERGIVRLSVLDHGVGIAPEMLDRVFDLFVQQSQTLDRSAGGLGLGLAIARNLTTMHGGRMSAHSGGLGHGAEFVMELPHAPHAEHAASRLALPSMARAVPSHRVLVIDDNADALQLLAEALRVQGHVVETALDGPAALARAAVFRPDVALVDIGLPVMDGYEVARRLRAQAGGPLRLIAITGYGLEGDRERAWAAGFDEHRVKPIDIAELERLIANDTSARQASHTPAA